MAPPDDDRIEQRLRQLFSAQRKAETGTQSAEADVLGRNLTPTPSPKMLEQTATHPTGQPEPEADTAHASPALPTLTISEFADEDDERDAAALAVVHFLLGETHCAVPLAEVREVHMLPTLTRVPNTAAHVIGLMNLRGNVVSVVDVRNRLSIVPTPPGQTARVLVFETDGELLGVLVDAVLGPARLPLPLMDPPVGSSAELLAGVVELDGTPITVLRTTGLTQWDDRTP